MSMPFFDDLLKELRYKINYDAIVNYAGNSFFEDSWDTIQRANPFNVEDPNNSSATMSALGKFLMSNQIEIVTPKTDDGEVLSAAKRFTGEMTEAQKLALENAEIL